MRNPSIMKQDVVEGMDEVAVSLNTGLEQQHHHIPNEEPPRTMQGHFSDLPSDLALNQYSFTTYARLEDVVGGSGGGSMPTKPLNHNRYDSHHPSTDDDYHRTHPDTSFDVLPVVHTSSDGHEDDDSGFEIRFKKLGLSHPSGLHESIENNNRAGQDTQTSQARTSSPQYGAKPPLITSRIERVLEDFSESDFSEDCGFYADDEDDEHQPFPTTTTTHQSTAPQQPTTSIPQQAPPEPALQPLDAPDTAPLKRHTRARTFPLRLHHAHHAHPPPNPAAAPSLSRAPLAPRFTGFANLPSTLPPVHPLPLHLQPHPGHPRPLPPALAHPHPHFAPNPAPLPLPLPRRQSEVVVDPAQDAFYQALKGRLWKLAQELEARGSGRVVRGAEGEGDEKEADTGVEGGAASSPPSPDARVVEEEREEGEFVDSEAELAEFFAGDEMFAPVSAIATGVGGRCGEEAGDGAESGVDSEEVLEMEERRAKEASVEALGQRRASEGRGRKWARERAQRGYKNWLKVPD